MTAYTKTMGQALREVYIEENNMAKMKKAAGGSMQTLKMKDGNLKMDKVTASAIMAVYNAVNDKNKKMIDGMLSGKKSDIMKLQKFALSKTKMTNASYNEEFEGEVDLDEGSWHISKNMNALKKKMQKPIPKGDLMVKFVMKHIGDDELTDEMFDAKTGTDMVPMIKSAMKRLNIKEEVDLDEARGMTAHVIVMRKKDNKNLSVSVVANTKNVNAKKKEGFVIDQAILAPNGATASFAKEIDRIIRDGDKNPKTGGYVKEEVELDEGYMELDFKDKQTAEKAYDIVNNEIWAGGNPPYKDFNQEGNSLQIDTDGNLNRRNQMLKDLKKGLPKNFTFKVAVNEHNNGTDHDHPHADEEEERQQTEASPRADAKRSMSRDKDLSRKRDSADDDNDASDDDVKAASKNIMMQLRKAANRASKGVEFGDKKKVMVDPKIAQAVASKYNSLRRPAEKQEFQNKIAKSYKDLLKAIKEENKPVKESILTRIDNKLMERKNG